MEWMKELKILNKQAAVIVSSNDLKTQREAFHFYSESLINVVRRFGTSGAQDVFMFHCPMAFEGKGSDWLQNNTDVKNPYYGEKMLKCGEQVDVLAKVEKQ